MRYPKRPTVSVIMPVFNCQKYLNEAIDSILDQVWNDYEFIITDDGSTDGSLDIIREYDDPRLKIISRSNRGLAFTLNEAIAMSSGYYIARMDADDMSHPERIEKQVAYLEENPGIGMVGASAVVITEDGVEICSVKKPKDDIDIKKALRRHSPFFHGSVMFRRLLFDTAGPYPTELENFFEDWVLFRKFAEVVKMRNLEECLYKFRLRPSATNMRKRGNLKRISKVVDNYLRNGELSSADRRQLMIVKSADILLKENERWANYYLEAALMLLEHGKALSNARKMLFRSLMKSPMTLKAWINLIYTLLPKSMSISLKKQWKEFQLNRSKRACF